MTEYLIWALLDALNGPLVVAPSSALPEHILYPKYTVSNQQI